MPRIAEPSAPKYAATPAGPEPGFAEVVGMIRQARAAARLAVNTALIDLYWRVGGYISQKIESAAWGEGVVAQLAAHIAREHPDLKGFTQRNLFRMRQFYEAYGGGAIVPPAVTQLPWTHHLIILGRARLPQEREFYVQAATRERWSKRELERRFNTQLFARVVANPTKAVAALKAAHPAAAGVFPDRYVVDFLDLPEDHSEGDLHRGLVAHMRRFLLDLGRDFCFVGERYRLQVGSTDFYLDLLFYLEALDRDVRKAHERPSIGVLLCASRDAKVVEYALARSASPALVAEYAAQLPSKALLEAQLARYTAAADDSREEEA